jgi:hypothetical protein
MGNVESEAVWQRILPEVRNEARNRPAYRVHHPAPSMTTRDVFDGAFFQWVKDGLAGRPQRIDRLGVAYMYMGQWVPRARPAGSFMWEPTLWW